MKVIVAMLCTCASTIWMSLSASLSNVSCFTICRLTQTCFDKCIEKRCTWFYTNKCIEKRSTWLNMNCMPLIFFTLRISCSYFFVIKVSLSPNLIKDDFDFQVKVLFVSVIGKICIALCRSFTCILICGRWFVFFFG